MSTTTFFGISRLGSFSWGFQQHLMENGFPTAFASPGTVPLAALLALGWSCLCPRLPLLEGEIQTPQRVYASCSRVDFYLCCTCPGTRLLCGGLCLRCNGVRRCRTGGSQWTKPPSIRSTGARKRWTNAHLLHHRAALCHHHRRARRLRFNPRLDRVVITAVAFE